MKLGELGRRTIMATSDLLNQQLSGQPGSYNARYLIDQLQNLYQRMQLFEPQDAGWYYLDADAYSANGNYRAAYLKLEECLRSPGGDASIKHKAQSLMTHIKPGYDAQQKMFLADRRAYEDYVSSGKQALDFAIVGATQRGNGFRDRGDVFGANIAYSRASQLQQQRMALNRYSPPDGSTVPVAQINASSHAAPVPASPAGGNEADKFGAAFFDKYAFGPLQVKRIHY